MGSKSPPAGWIRRLWPGEEEQLAEHLLRLGPADLRSRFMGSANEDTVRSYIGRVRRNRWHVIGWFQRGVLRAAVEISFEDGVAEAALTTEPDFRRQGIARRLLERAIRIAATSNARRLVLVTSPSNAPMLALARAAGASLRTGPDEVIAELELSQPDALALYLDLIEDRHGQVSSAAAELTAMADRALALWTPRREPPSLSRGAGG